MLGHFWDGNIPAPLKLALMRIAAHHRALFLGWKHPGPIEAEKKTPLQDSRRTFLGWKHPGPIEAPRRSRTVGTSAVFLGWKHPGPIEALTERIKLLWLKQISGMETSRPH